jgi:DNA-binding phage protein
MSGQWLVVNYPAGIVLFHGKVTKWIIVMNTTIYEDRARELVAEILQIIDAKGLNLANALQEAGISEKSADHFINQKGIPSLSEFIALCQISGISFHLPSIETPNTAM